MRVLAITQIWPNGKEPLSSPFNVQQFRELAKRCELRVLAALAYFPLAKVTKQPPRPALLADLPACETIAGIETTYMRQLYVPAIGVPVAVPLYVASLAPHRELLKWADVILGTWAYPDGCASVIAARALGKPCVVKVHGTDINVIAKRFTPRRVLSRVLPKADAMVTVSNPLGEEIAALGVPRSKIFLVANGVDTEVFAPRERDAAREELGVPKGRPLVVFVGRLEPQKGLVELLAAFDRVRALRPDAMLALVGDGVSRAQADEAAKRHDGALRVVGARPLREVARWLTACDVFTLPSHLEGTPNVVLEALASGRPAVATRVGGIPDVLGSPDAGILVEPRDADDLARGLLDALGRTWDPERVRAAGPGSWRQSAERLYDVLVRARGGGA